MRAREGITVVLLGLALTAARGTADMKALFAFNGRLVETTFPRLDYRIMTSVNEDGRYVLIRTPLEPPDGEPPFQIEIQLERIPTGTDTAGFEERAIAASVDRLGLETSEMPPGKLSGAGLTRGRNLQVTWNDTELRPHKGVLLCVVDNDVGMVVLLDVLAPDYDAAESFCLAILETIRID
jgi:hypothetical protein